MSDDDFKLKFRVRTATNYAGQNGLDFSQGTVTATLVLHDGDYGRDVHTVTEPFGPHVHFEVEGRQFEVYSERAKQHAQAELVARFVGALSKLMAAEA